MSPSPFIMLQLTPFIVGFAVDAAQKPCDIFAAGGTPCVAAHSTVRALYSNYAGPLYQVQRTTDGALMDVKVVAAGGFADVRCCVSIPASGLRRHLSSAALLQPRAHQIKTHPRRPPPRTNFAERSQHSRRGPTWQVSTIPERMWRPVDLKVAPSSSTRPKPTARPRATPWPVATHTVRTPQ